MYNGSNWDRKPQLSEILTEPLNPRDPFISVYIRSYLFISVDIRLFPFASVYIHLYLFIPVDTRLYLFISVYIVHICCTFKYSKRRMSDLNGAGPLNLYLLKNLEDLVVFKFFPLEKCSILTVSSLLFLKQKNANYFKDKPQLNIKGNMNDISSIFSFFTRQSFSGYPLYIGVSRTKGIILERGK